MEEEEDVHAETWDIALDDESIVLDLNHDEFIRANAIKGLMAKDPNLMKLTDLEVVQFSLAHPTEETRDLQVVLQQMERYQAFREEYKIQDTVEEGVACFNEMTLQHPGIFLNVQYEPKDGNVLLVQDWAAFFPGTIQTREQYSVYFKGLYYQFQAMNPTPWAMRKGISVAWECDGVTSANFDYEFFSQLVHQFEMSYPKRHHQMFAINSPSIVNTIFALWKRFKCPSWETALQLGYKCPGMDGERLSSLYHLPTPEIARQRIVDNVRQLLTIRYHHQATYTLPREESPLDDFSSAQEMA